MSNESNGQEVPPVLVRDVAEVLGVTVPEVCEALMKCGRPPRSTNMAVSGEELLAVAGVLKLYSSARMASLQHALERVDVKAQAGLCYFTLESAREFLNDIRDIAADVLGKSRPTR